MMDKGMRAKEAQVERLYLPMSHLRPVVVRVASEEPTGIMPQVGPSTAMSQMISWVP
jgi:hypothetical protein